MKQTHPGHLRKSPKCRYNKLFIVDPVKVWDTLFKDVMCQVGAYTSYTTGINVQ